MPTSPSALTSGPPSTLVRALRWLLGPLVRLLLEYQFTYPAFANLLKAVYVEEAKRGFAIPGRPQTASRLTLLTGIHRKDVKRLQDEPPHALATPTSVSLGAQLVLRWTTDPQYLSIQGEPIPLPRLTSDKSAPSFETLVESVSKDIRPRAILDEWRRLGIAVVDSDDRVQLVTNAFVPENGFDEKAYFFGRNLHDHLAATAHNLMANDDPMLERSVYYGNLRVESVEKLRALSTELGMDALQQINREARALQRADESESNAANRMTFGVYFYKAPQEQQPNDNADDRTATADDDENVRGQGGSDAV